MRPRTVYKLSVTLAVDPRLAELADRREHSELWGVFARFLAEHGYHTDGDLRIECRRVTWPEDTYRREFGDDADDNSARPL